MNTSNIQSLAHSKLKDLSVPESPGPIDLTPFLGDWNNTNPQSQMIRRIVMLAEGERLTMRAWGICMSEICDWGTIDVHPFGSGPDDPEGLGFMGQFELTGQVVHIAGNCKLGILVTMMFTTFTDDSGRHNYYGREFYHRT